MSADRSRLFEDWAARYDEAVQRRRFPFGDYERVLQVALDQLQLRSGARVLELGAGSGRLTGRLTAAGASVTAVDASENMIRLARSRAPTARFLRADLVDGAWIERVDGREDVRFVTATFVMHEFPLAQQVTIVRALARSLPELERVVLGDVGFPDAMAWRAGRARWSSLWDDEEHYWRGDELVAAFVEAGFHAAYRQLGDHNGVLALSQPS